MNGPYVHDRPSGAGHFMIALDITRFMPMAEFKGRMEQLVMDLKSVPLAQGFEEVYYPGEIEARNEAESSRKGLVLAEDTLTGLAGIARAMDLQPPF